MVDNSDTFFTILFIFALPSVVVMLVSFVRGLLLIRQIRDQRSGLMAPAFRRALWLVVANLVEPVVTTLWITLLLFSAGTFLVSLGVAVGLGMATMLGLLLLAPLLHVLSSTPLVRRVAWTLLGVGVARIVCTVLIFASSLLNIFGDVTLFVGLFVVALGVAGASIWINRRLVAAVLLQASAALPAVTVGREGVMITAANHQSANQPKIG